MPRRTNDFQKLVTSIHQALAPKGAKITESAMVKAPGFGDLREIDVLYEMETQPYHVKIAIETKDHKRKLSVTDIEAIVGKYRAGGALIVDKVVVVCRNGYSNQAVKKARDNGIELLTLTKAKNANWPGYLPLPQIKTLTLQLPPVVAHVQLQLLRSNNRLPGKLLAGRIIRRVDAVDVGSPQQFANHVLTKHLGRDARFQEHLRRGLERRQQLCTRVAWPMSPFLLSLDGEKHEIAQLLFHVHASKEVSDLEYSAFELSGDSFAKTVQRATASFKDRKIELVMPDGFKSEKIVMRFGDCDREFELNRKDRMGPTSNP